MIKKYIILLLIIFFVSFFILGCDKENRYTADEWKQIQEQEQKKIKNIEERENINDFERRLKEFTAFGTGVLDIADKHNIEIVELRDKFINENNLDKKYVYAELLEEKYSKWIEELSRVKTPDFLINLYDNILECETKQKLWYSYFLSGADGKDLSEVNSEMKLLDFKITNEFDRIRQNFNKEAEKLGLDKPFPDK